MNTLDAPTTVALCWLVLLGVMFGLAATFGLPMLASLLAGCCVLVWMYRRFYSWMNRPAVLCIG